MKQIWNYFTFDVKLREMKLDEGWSCWEELIASFKFQIEICVEDANANENLSIGETKIWEIATPADTTTEVNFLCDTDCEFSLISQIITSPTASQLANMFFEDSMNAKSVMAAVWQLSLFFFMQKKNVKMRIEWWNWENEIFIFLFHLESNPILKFWCSICEACWIWRCNKQNCR